MKKFLVVSMIGFLVLALFGCSELSNPVSNGQSGAQRPATDVKGTAAPSAFLGSLTSVVLQALPAPASGHQAVVSASGKITAAAGGMLQISYSYKTALGLLSCTRTATFTV